MAAAGAAIAARGPPHRHPELGTGPLCPCEPQERRPSGAALCHIGSIGTGQGRGDLSSEDDLWRGDRVELPIWVKLYRRPPFSIAPAHPKLRRGGEWQYTNKGPKKNRANPESQLSAAVQNLQPMTARSSLNSPQTLGLTDYFLTPRPAPPRSERKTAPRGGRFEGSQGIRQIAAFRLSSR